MTDRDVRTIRDLIHCQYATIIAKSAFAAFDGESSLKHHGNKKLLDFHPAASPLCRCLLPFKIQGVPVWAPEDDALLKASAFCYTYGA